MQVKQCCSHQLASMRPNAPDRSSSHPMQDKCFASEACLLCLHTPCRTSASFQKHACYAFTPLLAGCSDAPRGSPTSSRAVLEAAAPAMPLWEEDLSPPCWGSFPACQTQGANCKRSRGEVACLQAFAGDTALKVHTPRRPWSAFYKPICSHHWFAP